MQKHSLGFSVAASVIAIAVASPAVAQSGPPQSGTAVEETAATETGGVQDIVVTAQRVSERMQDVPVAITAFSSEQLETRGISSTLALEVGTPGLQVSRQGQSLSPYIRGIGTQYASIPGLEAPVALYVDGVYYPENAGNVFSLSNIERIEVLKGPQGTLFGRNSTGGLISVTTRDPTVDPHLEAGLTYGNYNTVEGKLYVSGGSGNVAADLAVTGIHQGKGFGRNVFTGREQDVQKSFAARSKIVWEASPEDKITLSLDYAKDRTNLGLGVTAAPGTALIDGLPGEAPNDSRGGGFHPNFSLTAYTGSLRYEHEFDWGSFSSLSAYRQVKDTYAWDVDGTPIPAVDAVSLYKTQSVQQEFLLTGKSGALRWAGGLFFFYADADSSTDIVLGSGGVRQNGTQTTTSYAAFAQATYELSDATSVTGGFRYTIDNRTLNGSTYALNGPLLFTELEDNRKTFRSPSWRLAIDHKITPDIMIYGRYDRGFKSGVFNVSVITDPAINPEKLDAFEVGLKSEFFDNTVRFNTSLFHYKYRGIQIGIVNSSGSSQVINAAEAKIQGIDAEATFAPRLDFGSLTLSVAGSVLDAKYTSFPNGPVNIPLPGGGTAPGSADLTGRTLPHAPKWTLSLSGDFSVPVGSGDIGISANYYHSDGFYWEADNNFVEGAYDVVNAQAYVTFGDDGRYKVKIFGKNLTNDHYGNAGFALGGVGFMYAYSPPRTYGVGFDVKF